MNHSEIIAEVKRDYEKLLSTTVQRLGKEYDRERKKFRIDNKRTYTKIYTVKTARKNNWIIVFGKAPSHEKYKGPQCITLYCVTYFHDATGLKVLHWTNVDMLEVYTGHFFQRYNERLNLQLSSPIDIVKKYFYNNRYSHPTCFEKNGHEYIIGFTKDGITLGEMQDDATWLVWKTFVSRDMLRAYQDEKEKEVIIKLLTKIKEAIQKEQFTFDQFQYPLDTLRVLTGMYDVK